MRLPSQPPRVRSSRLAVAAAAVALGCGSDPSAAFLQAELGQETDAWSASPAPEALAVQEWTATGPITLESFAATVEPIAIESDAVTEYQFLYTSASGRPVLRGRTLPIDPVGLAGVTIPVFVSRVGQFARPAFPIPGLHGEGALAAVLGERYVFVFGAPWSEEGLMQGDRYDLGFWTGQADGSSLLFECGAHECDVETLVVVDSSIALAIGPAGARWYDFSTFDESDASLPVGLESWADLSGGRAITDPDGVAWILGGTRDGDATDDFIRWAADETPTHGLLTTARAGAAAAWIEGRGLVVVGGSASGAGVELLAEGSDTFLPLPHASDDTSGAALVPLDNNPLRIGGVDADGNDAPTVRIPLGCGQDCAPEPFDEPLGLRRVSVYALDDGNWMAVGQDADGVTHAMHLVIEGTSVTPTEVPLRVERRRATSLALPTGHVAVVGGATLDGEPLGELELYLP